LRGAGGNLGEKKNNGFLGELRPPHPVFWQGGFSGPPRGPSGIFSRVSFLEGGGFPAFPFRGAPPALGKPGRPRGVCGGPRGGGFLGGPPPPPPKKTPREQFQGPKGGELGVFWGASPAQGAGGLGFFPPPGPRGGLAWQQKGGALQGGPQVGAWAAFFFFFSQRPRDFFSPRARGVCLSFLGPLGFFFFWKKKPPLVGPLSLPPPVFFRGRGPKKKPESKQTPPGRRVDWGRF